MKTPAILLQLAVFLSVSQFSLCRNILIRKWLLTVTTQLKLFVWYDTVGFVCLCGVTIQSQRWSSWLGACSYFDDILLILKRAIEKKSHSKCCKFRSQTHAPF